MKKIMGKSLRFYDPSSLGLDVVKFLESNDEVTCLCPFHKDRTPSATFNIVKGLFYCFKCDLWYTAKRLAEELGGTLEFAESFNRTKHFSVYNYEEWMGFFSAPLALDNEYLKMRGVDDDQVCEFDIRFANDRIIFLSRDINGLPNGVILRRIDGGRPRYQKLGIIPLWPLNRLPRVKRNILLVEGPFGVLRSSSAGYSSFALLKASPSIEAIRLLNGTNSIGFLDNDSAGHIGSAKLFKYLHTKIVFPGGEVDEMSHLQIRRRIKKRASYDISRLIQRMLDEGSDRALLRLRLI